ncbi:hypothetical protein [Chitinolyticbacter albus]|uniref:hypothetical protein n=1 Tax=Chitinolyticbacter albus TaxID=2961951 RepID=UPI00210C26C8|nr:hypothetical protein [Chitinolyticbacter albus]
MRHLPPEALDTPISAPRHGGWGRFTVSNQAAPPSHARLFQGRGWQTAVCLQFAPAAAARFQGRVPTAFALSFHTEDGVWNLLGLDVVPGVGWMPDAWSGHLAPVSWAACANWPALLPTAMALLAARGTVACYSQLTGYATQPVGFVDADGYCQPVWLRVRACADAIWSEQYGGQALHFGNHLAAGQIARWRLQAYTPAIEADRGFPGLAPQSWLDLGVIELDGVPAGQRRVLQPPTEPAHVPGIVPLAPDCPAPLALAGRLWRALDPVARQRLLRHMVTGLRRVTDRLDVLALLEHCLVADASFGAALAGELEMTSARLRRVSTVSRAPG